ncbi:short-chain dehydrogenase [Leptospira kobayashii]|uniref:Short-chain dehydrogenase n=1 Tax=Leptospira kobayashii TaxID=1917830 RepID=A0ABM7UMY9_9LEPT|nr:SDR family oxidoreductase [Leptospira kobayashii]BDA80470.1 short-chain dehydrogenase [Leptospira kobayashii]
MKTVLITGASTGLGKDFAELFAKDGYSLILVARNKGKLESLKNEIKTKYGQESYVFVKDLSLPGSAKELFDEIKKKNLNIDSLVNNAGIGLNGAFAENEFQEETQMLQLNVVTLVELTHLVLPEMIKRKSGEILNIASTAAFQPGPYMSGYYASKAYVLSFSEGIAEEVNQYGIKVSTLCPGPTKTEFFNRADMNESKLASNPILTMDSKTVAKLGYKALKKGQVVKIAGFLNFLLAQSIRISPRFMIRKIAKGLNYIKK